MNNRRFFPSIGMATILTILAFILSACAGGSPSVSGDADSRGTVPASKSTPAPALAAGGGSFNPMMPVVAGASWNYSLTVDTPDMTITQTISTVSASGFADQYVITIPGVGASTQNGNWQCSQGALANLTPWSASYEGPDVKNTYQATAMDGPTLPAAATAGNSWKHTYSVAVTSTGQNITDQVNENVSETCTIIGIEFCHCYSWHLQCYSLQVPNQHIDYSGKAKSICAYCNLFPG